MIKYPYKITFNKKLKAYTLIELVLSIALISIISTGLLLMVFASNLLVTYQENSYDNQLKLEYGLNYMINEIDSADFIISQELLGVLPENSLDIFLVKVDKNSEKKKYSITTYIYNNKKIIRLNYKKAELPKKIDYNHFSGKNTLIDEIENFSSTYESDSKLLTIKIEDQFQEIIKSHYIRGVIHEI